MIEACGLVKRYGSTMAVNDLSFSIRAGLVTGFLGPNGAGKPVTELRHSFPAGKRPLCSGPPDRSPAGRRLRAAGLRVRAANVAGLWSWG
jgi:ABC-2 type transport system ATP-binding protein